MNMWHCEIDDPRIVNLDPVRKLWMYNNWLADQNDKAELAKNTAYLLASFWNPEAVKQILGDGNTHESTEEEFEESLAMVKNQSIVLPNLEGLHKEEVTGRTSRRPVIVNKG